MDDPLWLEAAARVAAGLDDDTRAEAAEVYAAEAARCRLADRTGQVLLRLQGGHVVQGRLVPDEPIADHLVVDAGRWALVPVRAVLSSTGSRPALRAEAGPRDRSAASVLRDLWFEDAVLTVLGTDGATHRGSLCFVGADHVDVGTSGGPVTLPSTAIAAYLQT